jgi:5-methylcytosine-specific restriction endonuclease McrA
MEFLTRDHIIPECKGGKNTWENLVTACSTCNNKKADYDLEKTNLALTKKPSVPTLFELWMKRNQKRVFNELI